MSLIKAFAGLRPTPDYTEAVVAPPYDVLNTAEAIERAAGRPWSFLHISRPEIDLPADIDPYATVVYRKGAENLQKMLDNGVLKQDPGACYYVYRLIMGEHQQTGLVAAASVADYDTNRIRKHEFTRPAKEDDRVRQIDTLNAQTGPVLLAYKQQAEVQAIIDKVADAQAPEVNVTADDGIQHQIWVMDQSDDIAQITRLFDAMEALYIADGHHRSAAASRVAAARKAENSAHQGEEPYNYFLSVLFPDEQMKILDYNRVITDLNGLNEDEFLAKIGAHFSVAASDEPVHPAGHAEFGMYLRGRWFKLTLAADKAQPEDPVKRLDVSLLADYLIDPILGISDPRRDKRIDFVGGIRGLEGLEKRVDSGEMAVAFALYPTSMADLMSVADDNQVMPPKSTWFEPKLADGLVSHVL